MGIYHLTFSPNYLSLINNPDRRWERCPGFGEPQVAERIYQVIRLPLKVEKLVQLYKGAQLAETAFFVE
jgi:hypothetical protein